MDGPEVYVKNNIVQKRNIQHIINQHRDMLKNISGKCIDVGCGPGDATFELLLPYLHPNATLIGTDISNKAIKYAKENYCKSERLQFELMDIQTTDLDVKYIDAFDHIFSFHTINWCSDIKQAFRNIHRMLRLDGTILLCYRIESGFYDIFKALTHDERFASYHVKYEKLYNYNKNFVLKREGKYFLEEIGFHVYQYYHKAEYCTTEWLESNLSKFIDNNVSPLLTNLHSLKKEFMEELQKEVLEKSIDPEISVNFRKNLIPGDCAFVFAKKRKESTVE